MFPNWHDNINIPTVGDNVHIGSHIITIDANIVPSKGFQISVQPRTATGIISEQGRAIGILLQKTHDDTAQFLNDHLQPKIEPKEVELLRVDLKNLLENHRSALEYTAQHIAEF